MPRAFRFDHLHHGESWLSPGFLAVDDRGRVSGVGAEPPADIAPEDREWIRGYALPGVPNVHGHAFQRALAGHAEHRDPAGGDDSFWTWREQMYALANRVDPDDIEAIAALGQVEMLEAGYTSLGEFHYLHHDVGGARYGDPAETGRRILAAADRTGISLTLLPVLYQHGGFGQPLGERQARFGWRDVDEYLACVERLWSDTRDTPHHVGIAPHSLRAVTPAELDRAVLGITALDEFAPIHVHVAEQRKEVEQCLDVFGARPVSWLCANQRVDARWCLVHATHVDPRELRLIAERGSVVGLCPTTEANLGDGVFPLPEFAAQGGRFAIGSDSHSSIDVAEELRTLEYGLRLTRQQRNLAAAAEHPTRRHVGRFLFDRVVDAGARALAQPVGAFAPGRRADVVVLDPEHPRLIGHGPDTVLDAFAFSSAGGSPVTDVFVAGRRVVSGGRHARREEVVEDYRRTMAKLGR